MADGPTPRRTPNFTKGDGVALQDHLEGQIDALRCLLDARITAIEKAGDVASRRLDERLAAMNEFRAAMGDLSARMVTRAELSVQLEKIDATLDDLKQFRDRLDGKASQKSVDIALLLGLGGLILGIAALVIDFV